MSRVQVYNTAQDMQFNLRKSVVFPAALKTVKTVDEPMPAGPDVGVEKIEGDDAIASVPGTPSDDATKIYIPA